MIVFTHWSAAYIGRPWSVTGEGPEAFSCWGLVRFLMREHYGLQLPVVRFDQGARLDPTTLGAIKHAARLQGWRVLPQRIPPREGDIVVLESATRHHVGLVIRYRNRLSVIHCSQGCGVVREEWLDFASQSAPQVWRRDADTIS